MALQIEVTKVSVQDKGEKFNNDFYTITTNLKVLDGGIEIINRDFSIDYKSAHILSDKMTEIKESMKKEIERYQAEKTILDKLDTEVTKIIADLTMEVS